MKTRTLRGTVRGVAVLGLIAAAAAGAESAAAQGSAPLLSRELAVESSAPGLPVTFDGAVELAAMTPFRLPAGEGPFTVLRAGGQGFEPRRARLDWTASGTPRLTNDHGRRALLGTLLPGAGSLLAGRRLQGATEILGLGYLGVRALAIQQDTEDIQRHHRDLLRLLEDEADPLARAAIEFEAYNEDRHYALERDHRDQQLMLIGGSAALFILEGWWLNRPLDAQAGPGRLVLDVPRSSRGKTVLYSLLFPGLGQAYRQQRRSALYTAMALFGLDRILDAHARRERFDRLHEDTLAYYAAGGLDGGEAAALDWIWERHDRASRDMQWFAGLTGGAWLLGFLDALIVQEPDTAGGNGGLAVISAPSGRLGLAWTAEY